MLSPLRAFVVGSLGVLAITLVLLPVGDGLPRATPALLLMVPVVGAGALGGWLAAAAIALEASMAFAVGFLPPIGSEGVSISDDLAALGVFVVVVGTTGILVAAIVASQRRQVVVDELRIDALERADRQRGALLRSVSHDLRTPLATIRAVATDLSSEVPFPAHTRHELLGLVVDEAERLDRIVANLLSLSRIEAGSFMPDRQAVDVGELVDAAVSRLRRVLKNVRLEIDLQPDLPLVDLDYSQFDQVLSNLLENAVRHSPEGGVVRVEARARPDTFELQVIDQGRGFDPDVQDRVFEPFGKATGSGSSGVGLAICRAIVQAHDGTIEASNSPAGGACVTVRVPLDG